VSVLSALEAARQGYPALARLLVEATPMGEAGHNELTAGQQAFFNEVVPDGPVFPCCVLYIATPDGMQHRQYEEWSRGVAEFLASVERLAFLYGAEGLPYYAELSDNHNGDKWKAGDEEKALKALGEEVM
jgi:hypothetical protein